MVDLRSSFFRDIEINNFYTIFLYKKRLPINAGIPKDLIILELRPSLTQHRAKNITNVKVIEEEKIQTTESELREGPYPIYQHDDTLLYIEHLKSKMNNI